MPSELRTPRAAEASARRARKTANVGALPVSRCAAVNASARENSTRSPTSRPPRPAGGIGARATTGLPVLFGSPRSRTMNRPFGRADVGGEVDRVAADRHGKPELACAARDRRALEHDRRPADSIGERARRLGREVAPPAESRELVGREAEERHRAAVERRRLSLEPDRPEPRRSAPRTRSRPASRPRRTSGPA